MRFGHLVSWDLYSFYQIKGWYTITSSLYKHTHFRGGKSLILEHKIEK